MQIALIQFSPVFGRRDENTSRLVSMCRSVSADIYIMPELALSGYQFVSRDECLALGETKDSPRIALLRKTAAELNACLIVGYAENAHGIPYNSCLALLPDGQTVQYRKTHLFYRETLHFEPGDTGFCVFSFRGARIGLAICFDWFFPESFRTLALKGADIIAHCSNLVMPYCQKADFAQAVQNHLFIATANRVGTEARTDEVLRFTGRSVLVSPHGEYLLEGPSESEAVLVATIDPAEARNKHINEFNDVFAMRRPDHYREIVRREGNE
ncbi:MAG: acyltransferase [Rectinema sp.]|nr:acyltransferase [Rectinema sp.]